MSLCARLLLLALGKKTDDPYERESARAVRAYLAALLFRSVTLSALNYGLGYLLFRSHVAGMVFFFLPAGLFYLTLGYGDLDPRFIFREKAWTLRRVGEEVGGLSGIPRMKVFVSDDCGVNAYCCMSRGKPYVVVHTDLVRVLRCTGLSGVIAHEIGHAVLPFGGFAFAFIEHFFGLLPDAIVHFALFFKRSRLALLLLRLFWPLSSLYISHMRERACDTLGAMILRDPIPLVIGFRLLELHDPKRMGGLGATHPITAVRIRHLRELHERVTHTSK